MVGRWRRTSTRWPGLDIAPDQRGRRGAPWKPTAAEWRGQFANAAGLRNRLSEADHELARSDGCCEARPRAACRAGRSPRRGREASAAEPDRRHNRTSRAEADRLARGIATACPAVAVAHGPPDPAGHDWRSTPPRWACRRRRRRSRAGRSAGTQRPGLRHRDPPRGDTATCGRRPPEAASRIRACPCWPRQVDLMPGVPRAERSTSRA